MSHDIEQHNAAPSATRRTVLTGAAWSVPVIAAASLAPLAAASDTVTLAFDKSTYNGTACGTISGAYVTVTVNGVATAGKSVTTTLSNGYKFSDGTTTNTQVSGSDGRVSLPAINVPASGGTGTVSASSLSAVTATATVTATSQSATWIATDNLGWVGPLNQIPADATPTLAWGFFLHGTDLWSKDSIFATNVTKATGGTVELSNGGGSLTWVQYLEGSTWKAADDRGWSTTLSQVPASATPLDGWGYFLDGTNLWYRDAIIDTNVTKALANANNHSTSNLYPWVEYLKGSTWIAADTTGWSTTLTQIPSTATPLRGWGYFLNGSDLWSFDTIIATNVGKASAGTIELPNGSSLNWVVYLEGSTWKAADSRGWSHTLSAIPSSAKPLDGWGYFLDGTDLWYYDSIVQTNVTNAVAGSMMSETATSYNWCEFLRAPSC